MDSNYCRTDIFDSNVTVLEMPHIISICCIPSAVNKAVIMKTNNSNILRISSIWWALRWDNKCWSLACSSGDQPRHFRIWSQAATNHLPRSATFCFNSQPATTANTTNCLFKTLQLPHFLLITRLWLLFSARFAFCKTASSSIFNQSSLKLNLPFQFLSGLPEYTS